MITLTDILRLVWPFANDTASQTGPATTFTTAARQFNSQVSQARQFTFPDARSRQFNTPSSDARQIN